MAAEFVVAAASLHDKPSIYLRIQRSPEEPVLWLDACFYTGCGGNSKRRLIMSDEQNSFQSEGSPRWMGLAVVGLAILSLVGVGMAWNATNHANEAQQAFAAQSKTILQTTQTQDGITQRVAQAEQTNAQMQGELNLVTDK